MVQNNIYTEIQETNPVSNERYAITDIQNERRIPRVISVLAAA
jgi:hypothetical protein